MLIKFQNFKASTEFEPMTTPFTYSAVVLDHFMFLGNCPPTPPQSPH